LLAAPRAANPHAVRCAVCGSVLDLMRRHGGGRALVRVRYLAAPGVYRTSRGGEAVAEGGGVSKHRGAGRDTGGALVGRGLQGRLGSDRVFLDCRSIPAGADFAEELLGRLRACSVLVVVIGPRWLTLTDAAGQRRIDDPADWIRREITEALSAGLRVIPVLTGGAVLPAAEDLPADIAGLSRRQYL